jgi:hypothetical protein
MIEHTRANRLKTVAGISRILLIEVCCGNEAKTKTKE